MKDDSIYELSDVIHHLFKGYLPKDLALILEISVKVILLFLIIFIIDFILKKIIRFSYSIFRIKIKNPILEALRASKVYVVFGHFLSLGLGKYLAKMIFYQHTKSVIEVMNTIIYLLLVFVIFVFFRRLLKTVNYYFEHRKDFYKITAIRAITDSLNIFSIIVFTIIGIQVIFKVEPKTILGSIGAMAAFIILIFRDTILGFITGIHVSTSKSLKVGDWIGIPKYDLEGNIQEISLLTTKIINFDKTISTIPTYDLLSTEIKNNQVMSESNIRRIKRSITFNIESFKFLTEEDIQKLMKINILSDYLKAKLNIIQKEKETINNADVIFNGHQLTNIGVFRMYVYKYLETNPKINEKETIVVRHLQASSQGLPLEIYCFANESALKRYEEIQADIFDHLLTVAKEFELSILQFGFKI